MVDDTNIMFDLEKELSWIDNKYSEIVESANNNEDGYQSVMEDTITDDTNDTIENIERFIDDSYVAMLEQKNAEKDFEISFLIEELSNAYEVQDQVIMDSYALPLQFVENDKKEEAKEEEEVNKYKDCHVRLCYELYLEAYERDRKNEKKEKNFGILRFNLKGLKIKNIKPLLASTKHLFKKKTEKINKIRKLNNYNPTMERMLTDQHY